MPAAHAGLSPGSPDFRKSSLEKSIAEESTGLDRFFGWSNLVASSGSIAADGKAGNAGKAGARSASRLALRY